MAPSARLAAALAAFCLCIAAAPTALAVCAFTSTGQGISSSSFDLTVDPGRSSTSQLCLTVSNSRTCDAEGSTCCMGDVTAPMTKLARLTLSGANGACVGDRLGRAKLFWAVNGRRKVPKFFGSDVVVPIGSAGSATVCVQNFGTNSECDVGNLFSGVISFQLETAKTTKKLDLFDKSTWTKNVQCCLDGDIASTAKSCANNNGDCPSNSVCDDSSGSVECSCNSGFQMNGNVCQDTNECADNTNNCSPDATCTNTQGSFTCACNPGFSGNGVTCTQNGGGGGGSNQCDTNNGGCDAHASCFDNNGDVSCACNSGYTGDGTTCADINECDQNPCQAGETCTNTEGSFTCTPDNGGGGGSCANNNGGCSANADCSEGNAGVTCTCKNGFSGDGNTCTDINECDQNPCQAGETCTNTEGSFTCTPDNGGGGGSCANNNGGCSANADCSEGNAGVTCTCKNGFSGDGNTCTDINECDQTPCQAGETCTNTEGSFTCTPGGGGGSGGFQIKMVNAGTDHTYDAIFEAAAARWEKVIIKDLPDFDNAAGQDLSGGAIAGFSYTEPVDDIVIVYEMANIDGPSNILGSAGPVMTRNSDKTPISGHMTFDSSDIGTTISDEDFKNVVLHEMGHVLGIGTLWENFGCLGSCTPGSNADVFYQCDIANQKYQESGGSGNVPIETQMGDGSGCGHWRERTLDNEIMTPVLNSGTSNPLSVITIATIEDMYGAGSVDYSQADSYTVPNARQQADYKPVAPKYRLVLKKPTGTVDV